MFGCGSWFLSSLKKKINATSTLFTLIGDKATSVATRIELSMCVCYLYGSRFPVESFVTVYKLPTADAKSVKEAVEKADQKNVVWQVYDGASVISEKKKWVRTKILQESVPHAQYIHCRAHCLNLALEYASFNASEIHQTSYQSCN